jgi:hypothetical protein
MQRTGAPHIIGDGTAVEERPVRPNCLKSARGLCCAAVMKRITFAAPDELNLLLERERRRRDASAGHVIREALSAYLTGGAQKQQLTFIGVGHSGHHDTARTIDAVLAEERDRDRRYGSARSSSSTPISRSAGPTHRSSPSPSAWQPSWRRRWTAGTLAPSVRVTASMASCCWNRRRTARCALLLPLRSCLRTATSSTPSEAQSVIRS